MKPSAIVEPVGSHSFLERTIAPIAGVELRHLRYLIAAIDHGSFRKAAIGLRVRESAVSRRIRDLEASVGAQLFIRSPNGARPTEAGLRFQRRAEDMLRTLAAALDDVNAAGIKISGDI